MKTSFFESISGNKSSSRLIGASIIFYAMLMSTGILLCVFLLKELSSGDIIAIVGSSTGFFTTVSGGAMIFLFNQKKTEVKQEKTAE